MFRKKRTDTSKKDGGIPVEYLASLIVKAIKRIQELFVQMMTAAFEKIGLRHSKIVFVVVLTATGLYSLYLTGASLLQPKKGIQPFRPVSIQQPATIKHEKIENGKSLIEADTATAGKLRQFDRYFDNMKNMQPKQYDSILQSRPGLIDSIRMLEQIYYSQQKK